MNISLTPDEKEISKRCNSEPNEQLDQNIKRNIKFDIYFQNDDNYLNANKVEKIKTVEWENYFNEGFDIYSINNEIVPKRYSNINYEQMYQNANIEFKIDNIQDFSFKENEESEERKKTEPVEIVEKKFEVFVKDINISDEINNNSNDNLDKENQIPYEHIKNVTEENDDKENFIVDKNENNFLSEQFLKDEEFDNDSKITEPEVNAEINNTKEEKVTDIISEQNLNKENEECEEIIHPVAPENSIDQEYMLSEHNELIEDRPQPFREHHKQNSKDDFSKDIIKSKDEEIKTLNEKLLNQKQENKLILDENKKLLEVIGIFKMFQNFENKSYEAENLNSEKKTEQFYKTHIVNPSIYLEKDEGQNKIDKEMIDEERYNNNFDSPNIPLSFEFNREDDLNLQLNMDYIKEVPEAEMENYSPENSKVREINNNYSSRYKTYINTNKVKKTSYGDIYMKSKENSSTFKNNTYQGSFPLQIKKQFGNFEKNETNPNSTRKNVKPVQEPCHSPRLANTNKVSPGASKSFQRCLKKSEINQNTKETKLTDIIIENNNKSYVNSKFEIRPGLYSSPSPYSFNELSNKNTLEDNIQMNPKSSTHRELQESPLNDTKYGAIIHQLEKYKELNEKLISNLNKEDFALKIDVNKRKTDVKNLEQILSYINSVNLEETKAHLIPFYLVDKRKIYQNIVKYISDKKIQSEKSLKKFLDK